MAKLTTTEELERVHLRFLKVPNNQKLSQILAKLLPNMLEIYFEEDFQNMAPSAIQDSPKFKALEETMSHLALKTTNAKGEVKIPFASLINIFHSEKFLAVHS
jgi:hypothetical protein